MLAERDRKLAEKEAYIVHLQTALAGETPPQVGHSGATARGWGGGGGGVDDGQPRVTSSRFAPFPQAAAETEKPQLQELQPLVQSLNRKVEEWEERCALLQEQAEGLKALLQSEQERYSQKESMYEKDVGDVAPPPPPPPAVAPPPRARRLRPPPLLSFPDPDL